MELQPTLQQNGQELRQNDVNDTAKAGALADDRTLAELFRLAAYDGSNVSKVILPYGADADTKGTVYSKIAADGSVYIKPFRAVVGSRTAVATNAIDDWRDIRSAVCVGGKDVTATNPPTSLDATQAIAANGSGHARWDLVYAIVSPDAVGATDSRAVKAPTSGVVTTPTITTRFATKVSLGYLQGTAAASPTLPAVPADTSTVFNIPLAYVIVPDGFGASSTVRSWQLMDQAPTPIALSKGIGGASARPANQQNEVGGQVVTTTSEAAWANNSTYSISARPNVYMPPSMTGVETVWIAIDLSGTSSSGWSHQNGSPVDTSRDWRNRVFRTFWTGNADSSSNGHFAWDRGTSATIFLPRPPAVAGTISTSKYFYNDMGQSFIADASQLTGGGPSNSSSIVSAAGNSQLAPINSDQVALYVDQTDGSLRLYLSGTGADCMLFLWIESSRPYPNY